MAIGLIGNSQHHTSVSPTRFQLNIGFQAGHHHNGNAHHDRAGISHEARSGNVRGGSHPLLNGLRENFGGCGRGGSAQQLKQGLAKWEQAKCPKAKQAAAQELGQAYKDCKAQGVKLNPKLELKVVLILALSGADGSQDGGKCGGGQKPQEPGEGKGKCDGDRKKPECDKDKKKPRCEKGDKPKHKKPAQPKKPGCPRKTATKTA